MDTLPHRTYACKPDAADRIAQTLGRLAKARVDDTEWDATDDCAQSRKAPAESVARALSHRFPGPQRVCADWRRIIRENASGDCHRAGLSLCIGAIDALGVIVHDVGLIDGSIDKQHMPLDLDDLRSKVALDSCFESDADNHLTSAAATATAMSSQMVLTCSRKLPDRDAHLDDAPQQQQQQRGNVAGCGGRRLLVEVRVGLGRWPWATAGNVVCLETGDVIYLACTLVCNPRVDFHQHVGVDTMLAQRRLLADFLHASDGAWEAFAQRRYANLRRLPEVLATRGWTVCDVHATPWSWGRGTTPTVETCLIGPSLWLERPDVPVKVSLCTGRGRLVLASDALDIDSIGFDWPTLFASDPPGLGTYGDFSESPLHQCDAHCIGNGHFTRVTALQRERLVAMGLVSPVIVSGPREPFYDRRRTTEASPKGSRLYWFDGIARVLVDADPVKMADIIERHIAHSVFGEYGPVDPHTRQHLSGGLCDRLVDDAMGSGRLWSGLAHIDGAHFKTSEGVVDPFGDDEMDCASPRSPRLTVNWRLKCTPTRTDQKTRQDRSFRMSVWAVAVVQSDGCGSACVALTVSKKTARRLRNTTDRSGWRYALERCVRGDIDCPPDLHPAVTSALLLERECDKVGYLVPCAYHTGGTTDQPVDARILTLWILDRVRAIFEAFDTKLSAMAAYVQSNIHDDDDAVCGNEIAA